MTQVCSTPPGAIFLPPLCSHGQDGRPVCLQPDLPVLAERALTDPITHKRKLFMKLLCFAVTKLNLLHMWH